MPRDVVLYRQPDNRTRRGQIIRAAGSASQVMARFLSRGRNNGPPRRHTRSTQTTYKAARRSRWSNRGGIGSHTKNGVSSVKSSYRMRKAPRKQMGLGVFRYTEVLSGSMTSISGNQGFGDMFAMGTTTQFTKTAQSNTVAYGDSNIGYFAMNPNSYTNGSSLFSNRIPSTERIFLKGFDFKIKFTNMESIAAYATIYFVTPKNNCSAFPINMWGDLTATEANGQANIATGAPGTYNSSTAGAAIRQTYGESPFSLAAFRQTWKKLNVVKLTLASGASEDVNFSCQVNKLISKQKIINDGTFFQKGVSVHVFYTIHGQVVIDKTGGTAHVNTLGSTEVGWVVRQTARLTLLKAQVSNVDVNRAFVAPGTGATLNDQYAINEEDDVEAIKQA